MDEVVVIVVEKDIRRLEVEILERMGIKRSFIN